MSAIIFLIFIGILVAGGFLAAFIWAVRSGQYDDDYSPSVRMLFDNKSQMDQKELDKASDKEISKKTEIKPKQQ
jgi:cbb3-type cytochrome oxidase maturation protein